MKDLITGDPRAKYIKRIQERFFGSSSDEFDATSLALIHRGDHHLGTSFSAETNQKYEDTDLMKYIETELKKRKGIIKYKELKMKSKNAEDCLYGRPENICVSSAKNIKEMLSNQKLSIIPEVDPSIAAKIKNKISIDYARDHLLAEQHNKKEDGKTSFMPINMAVNYMQLNQFYHEELNDPIQRNKEEPKAHHLRVDDTKKPQPELSPCNHKCPANEMVADDYCYEVQDEQAVLRLSQAEQDCESTSLPTMRNAFWPGTCSSACTQFQNQTLKFGIPKEYECHA
ncbi:telomere length and silencing protein 1 homolog [Tupaia chinensis]|uniref:telomere length and silencing protein 1 homolog n=1 Tax=Tupaia chinensis TaxID=246437 RepID=UPI0003C8CDC4|nr:telomere length and silencing protein 1 homolog [Tupaia chinensis]